MNGAAAAARRSGCRGRTTVHWATSLRDRWRRRGGGGELTSIRRGNFRRPLVASTREAAARVPLWRQALGPFTRRPAETVGRPGPPSLSQCGPHLLLLTPRGGPAPSARLRRLHLAGAGCPMLCGPRHRTVPAPRHGQRRHFQGPAGFPSTSGACSLPARGFALGGAGFEPDLFHKAHYVHFSCRGRFEKMPRLLSPSAGLRSPVRAPHAPRRPARAALLIQGLEPSHPHSIGPRSIGPREWRVR